MILDANIFTIKLWIMIRNNLFIVKLIRKVRICLSKSLMENCKYLNYLILIFVMNLN